MTSVGGACSATDLAPISVTITGNGPQSATGTCSGGAWTATLTTPISSAGTSSVNASQNDAAGNTGTSGAKSITVVPPSLTVSGPVSSAAGQPIPTSAIRAVLGGTGPTGTITFKVFGPQAAAPTSCTSGGTSVGTATVSGLGAYSPATAFTPASAGTYWWYASYGGDANNAPADAACGTDTPQSIVGQVSGSPFSSGGTNAAGLAFRPTGGFVAVTNLSSNTVAMFGLNENTGALTAQVEGSPVSTGGLNPQGVAFSPDGALLAVANLDSSTVSMFKVNPTSGVLTPAGSPVAAGGSTPRAVAFSPDGAVLAVANIGAGGRVATFTVNPTTGALTSAASIAGPPGGSPSSVAFRPGGGYLAVANDSSPTVSVYSVTSGGALAAVAGSPFSAGNGPRRVTFTPNGNFLASSNFSSSTVSVWKFDPSSAAFLTPVAGSPFVTGGGPVSAAFSPTGTCWRPRTTRQARCRCSEWILSLACSLRRPAPRSPRVPPRARILSTSVVGVDSFATPNLNASTVSVVSLRGPQTVVVSAKPTATASAPTTATAGTLIPASSIGSTLSSGASPTGTVTFRVFGPQASAPTGCGTGGTIVGTTGCWGMAPIRPQAGSRRRSQEHIGGTRETKVMPTTWARHRSAVRRWPRLSSADEIGSAMWMASGSRAARCATATPPRHGRGGGVGEPRLLGAVGPRHRR